MAETFTEAASKDKNSEGTLTWLDHNVLNPMLNAGPLGIYNAVASVAKLPECKLKTDEAKPYSAEWFTQNLSSGVGAVLPFVLASKGAGMAMRPLGEKLAATSFAESSMGSLAVKGLMSDRAATVVGASLYGGLQKPEAGHTRFGDAMGTGLGFLAFEGGNQMLSRFTPAGSISRALSYPLVGLAGGAAMSEGTQLFSNGHLAGGSDLMQSAVQGATLNSFMPLAGRGLEKLTTRSADSVPSQGTDTPAAPRSISEIIARQQAYSDWAQSHRVSYPTPEQFGSLTPEEMVNRGFYHPDAQNIGQLEAFKENGKRPLPPADQVHSEVKKLVGSMPMAGETGQLHMGEWNMEFLTGDKARYFADTYKEIVPRHHLMWVEEANKEGLAQIAQDNGYNYVISRENSRGQAVGFLVNPRLEVLRTTSYDDVANVYNIPDERPALRIDLRDKATGKEFSAVAVHLKSMMGGEEKTSPVRTEQSRLLANHLTGDDFHGVVAGDWNTFLDKTSDIDPLRNAGFRVLDPNNHTSTQSMGGRLDGFLVKGMDGQFSTVQVRPFFQDKLITRGLSDHGLLTTYYDPSASGFRWSSLASQLPFSWQRAGTMGTVGAIDNQQGH